MGVLASRGTVPSQIARGCQPCWPSGFGAQEGSLCVLTTSEVESLLWDGSKYEYSVYYFSCIPGECLPQAWGVSGWRQALPWTRMRRSASRPAKPPPTQLLDSCCWEEATTLFPSRRDLGDLCCPPRPNHGPGSVLPVSTGMHSKEQVQLQSHTCSH